MVDYLFQSPILEILLFVAVSLLIVSPLWAHKFSKGIQWHRWEFFIPIIIVLTWYPTSVLKGGSLSNAVIEFPIVCVLGAVEPWVRVLLPKFSAKLIAVIAIALTFFVAFFIPTFPE